MMFPPCVIRCAVEKWFSVIDHSLVKIGNSKEVEEMMSDEDVMKRQCNGEAERREDNLLVQLLPAPDITVPSCRFITASIRCW